MLMPARVVATLIELQTRPVVVQRLGNRLLCSTESPVVIPFHTAPKARDVVDATGSQRAIGRLRERHVADAPVGSPMSAIGVTAMRLLTIGTPYVAFTSL